MYESWFSKLGGIPYEWIKAGEWKIPDNFICGDDKVSFYAVTPEERNMLENNLKKYSNELPESVIQSGKYVDN